jgi:hypothetical protein
VQLFFDILVSNSCLLLLHTWWLHPQKEKKIHVCSICYDKFGLNVR